jgi:hypothetical protein
MPHPVYTMTLSDLLDRYFVVSPSGAVANGDESNEFAINSGESALETSGESVFPILRSR